MGKCEASTKAIKLTLGSHSQTKDDTEMFAWSNRWGKSAYTTGSNRLINEQLDIQQVKSKGHSSWCEAHSPVLGLYHVVHTLCCGDGQSESGKRQRCCYGSLVKKKKKNSGPVQDGLKHRRISKGRRDMQKNKGFHQLSARGIPQRGKEAFTRAARRADIIRSQPHKGLWHRAEQRNRVGGKSGMQILERTELALQWYKHTPCKGYSGDSTSGRLRRPTRGFPHLMLLQLQQRNQG